VSQLSELAKKEVEEYIRSHVSTDVNDLLLKGGEVLSIPMTEIVEQISCRKKAKTKLPTWNETLGIVFPSKQSVEQASSESVSSIRFTDYSGNTCIDATGGLGIDSWTLSKKFNEVTYLEINDHLAESAIHNFSALGESKISVHKTDSIDFLQKAQPVDLLYIDPSRRDKKSNRKFLLHDMQPNIIEHWPMLLSKAKIIVVKLSPMLDITAAASSLSHVKRVIILASKNEVKELVIVASLDSEEEQIRLNTLNLAESSQNYDSDFPVLTQDVTYSLPKAGDYIYLPNAAIMKAGLQDKLAAELNLEKWQGQTHFYHSHEHISDFQGRILKTVFVGNLKSKYWRQNKSQANFVLRNVPLKPGDVAKRLSWKQGGGHYILCGKNEDNRVSVVHAEIID